MAFDTEINRQALINVYSDLAGDSNFQILSARTPIYNCIAWAMGYDDRWVEPVAYPGCWWPSNAQRGMSPEALISAFKAEGFELSENRFPEEGYSKVVLYKKADSEEWTHAARIITADIEYSKFGAEWDCQHSHNVLCNTTKGQEDLSYGVPYAYMKRKDTATSSSIVSGKITVDAIKLAKLKDLLHRK